MNEIYREHTFLINSVNSFILQYLLKHAVMRYFILVQASKAPAIRE